MARTKQTNKKRTNAEMLADSALPAPAATAAKKRAATKKKSVPAKKKSKAAAAPKKKSAAAPKKKAPPSPTTPVDGFNSIPEQPIPPAAVPAATLATKENATNQPAESLPVFPTVAPPLHLHPHAPQWPQQPQQPWQQQQQQQQQQQNPFGPPSQFGPPAQYGAPAPPSAPVWLTGPNGEPMLFWNGQLIPVPPQVGPSFSGAAVFPSAQSASTGPVALPTATQPTAPIVGAPTPLPAPIAASGDPPSAEPDYLTELAKASKNHILLGSKTADAAIRSQTQGSVTYAKRKIREFNQFCNWIENHPVLSHWAEKVKSKNDAEEEIPKWIHAVQNVPANNKDGRIILNIIFIEWFETQKDSSGLKLMQPSSMETKIKKLFSVLHEQFQVHLQLRNLKGEGSLYAHCESRWKEIAEHNPSFGAKPFREVFTEEELQTVVAYIRSLDEFDLDARAHEIAVVSLGRHCAFRGRTDHYSLTWDMVQQSVFEDGHPFAGEQSIQIGNGLLSKHNQLTFGNTTAKSDVEAPRIPIRMDDPFNPGAALLRLRRLTPPDAKFVFKPGSRQNALYLESGIEGSKDWRYHHEMSMGITKIGACTQEIAKAAGLSNWQKKTNHCLRNTAITDLANDPNVNQKETATFSRHKSENSQNAYIKPSAKAEISRISALEVKPKAVFSPRDAGATSLGLALSHSAQQIAQMASHQPQPSSNPYVQPSDGTSNAASTPKTAHNSMAPATGN